MRARKITALRHYKLHLKLYLNTIETNPQLKITDYIVEKILEHKDIDDNRYYLIKWKKYDEKFNTWETRICLKNCHEILDEYHNNTGTGDIRKEQYEKETITELDVSFR